MTAPLNPSYGILRFPRIDRKGLPTLIAVAFGLTLLSCAGGNGDEWRQAVIRGHTMGTTYSVKVVYRGSPPQDKVELKKRVDSELRKVNRLMSTYDPESELSRFNLRSSTAPFKVSPETLRVVRAAKEIFLSTGGAFDPTVGPLVELWGFGAKGRRTSPPPEKKIREALAEVGMDHVVENPDGTLSKTIPTLELDLSAIAKGYGVDRVEALLESLGYKDLMVEIGGEIDVRGKNLQRKPWRLGVDSPIQTPGRRNLVHTLALTDAAVATSGDYRNCFVYEGVLYSHEINPQTGWPVHESVKSVSVVAPTCMTADGAATAVMVLGATRGLQWAEKRKDLEALLIVKSATGELKEERTSGMSRYVLE